MRETVITAKDGKIIGSIDLDAIAAGSQDESTYVEFYMPDDRDTPFHGHVVNADDAGALIFAPYVSAKTLTDCMPKGAGEKRAALETKAISSILTVLGLQMNPETGEVTPIERDPEAA